jgi:hypothetical protein
MGRESKNPSLLYMLQRAPDPALAMVRRKLIPRRTLAAFLSRRFFAGGSGELTTFATMALTNLRTILPTIEKY